MTDPLRDALAEALHDNTMECGDEDHEGDAARILAHPAVRAALRDIWELAHGLAIAILSSSPTAAREHAEEVERQYWDYRHALALAATPTASPTARDTARTSVARTDTGESRPRTSVDAATPLPTARVDGCPECGGGIIGKLPHDPECTQQHRFFAATPTASPTAP